MYIPVEEANEECSFPLDVPKSCFSRTRTFRAFRYRDFRLMWMGACVSTIGTFVQQFAQSWLVSIHLTKNQFYLGLHIFLGNWPRKISRPR